MEVADNLRTQLMRGRIDSLLRTSRAGHLASASTVVVSVSLCPVAAFVFPSVLYNLSGSEAHVALSRRSAEGDRFRASSRLPSNRIAKVFDDWHREGASTEP